MTAREGFCAVLEDLVEDFERRAASDLENQHLSESPEQAMGFQRSRAAYKTAAGLLRDALNTRATEVLGGE